VQGLPSKTPEMNWPDTERTLQLLWMTCGKICQTWTCYYITIWLQKYVQQIWVSFTSNVLAGVTIQSTEMMKWWCRCIQSVKCFKYSSFSSKTMQNLLTTLILCYAIKIMTNKMVYNVTKIQYLLLSQSQTFFSPLVSQFSSEAWSLCKVETAYDENSRIPTEPC